MKMDIQEYEELRRRVSQLSEEKRTTATYLIELESKLDDAKSICVLVLDKSPILKDSISYHNAVDHITLAQQVRGLRRALIPDKEEGETTDANRS